MCRSQRSVERALRRKRRSPCGTLPMPPNRSVVHAAVTPARYADAGDAAPFLSLALRSFYAIAVLRSRSLIRQL